MSAYAVVFVTTSNLEEARRIARTLVEERLAACVNIAPQVESIYRWQGKVEVDQEALMIIKTRRALYDALTARVKELHSYQVCEVIALPIVTGNPEYLAWIDESTG